MADILGIQAFSLGTVLENWWEYTLVAIICVSALIGTVALLWTFYGKFRTWIKVRVFQISITRGTRI